MTANNSFIPDKPTAPKLAVKFFEDVTAKDVPGASGTKSLDFYEKRIRQLLLKLDAASVTFSYGNYPSDVGTTETYRATARYGCQIQFQLIDTGLFGRLDAAALPLRGYTAHKKDRALAQALYLVGNWLEAEAYSVVYRPGAIALVPYLLGESGRTVTEELVARQKLPEFSPYYLPAPMLPEKVQANSSGGE